MLRLLLLGILCLLAIGRVEAVLAPMKYPVRLAHEDVTNLLQTSSHAVIAVSFADGAGGFSYGQSGLGTDADDLRFGIDNDGQNLSVVFPHRLAGTWNPNGTSKVYVKVDLTKLVNDAFYAYYDFGVSAQDQSAEVDVAPDFLFWPLEYGPAVEFKVTTSKPRMGGVWLERIDELTYEDDGADFFWFNVEILSAPSSVPDPDNEVYFMWTEFIDLSPEAEVLPYDFYDGDVRREFHELVLETARDYPWLRSDRFYSWRVVASKIEGDYSNEYSSRACPWPVFAGRLELEAVTNAYELEKTPARVRVSLPADVTAPPGGFKVRYFVTGTNEEAYLTFRQPAGYVTIPANSNCTEIAVRPKWAPTVTNDVDLFVSLFKGSCYSDSGAVRIRVIDDNGLTKPGLSVIMR